MKRELLGYVVGLLACVGVAAAPAQFLNSYDGLFNSGARSGALGNAVISDARDAGMMFLNPAALTNLPFASVFLDHSAMPGQGSVQSVGFVVPTGSAARFAMAVAAGRSGTITLPDGGQWSADTYALHLGQALLLAQSFSAGVSVETEILKSDGPEVLGLTTLLGLLYSPSPEVSYAITLKGLGVKKPLRLDQVEDLSLEPSPAVLGIAMSMRFPPSFDRQDFTLALANEKEFGSIGLTYRFGVEYYPTGFLALRLGAVTGPFEHGLRIGAGLRTEPLLLDLAFDPGSPGERFQVSTFIQW